MRTSPTALMLELWSQLGIDPQWVTARNLPLFDDAQSLIELSGHIAGRTWQLTPSAANAWFQMQAAASAEGVDLVLISAWRGIRRQAELINGKLAQGEDIRDVLQRLAPPGCSEHHTGRAIDIATAETTALDEQFALTEAFAWLELNAGRFGFTLSFPRGNASGYTYEPWHWCHAEQ